jgi:hypothetical protein
VYIGASFEALTISSHLDVHPDSIGSCHFLSFLDKIAVTVITATTKV